MPTDRRERLRQVEQAAAEELRRFVRMFAYLYLLLAAFAAHEDVVLRERGITMVRQGYALVNALVLAKVMLIAEDLGLGRRLKPKPLIYPVVLDALILALLFILVHVLEHVVGGLLAGETLAASVPAIGGGGFQGLLCVAFIMFVALIPYFAYTHLGRELGPGRMHALMFGDGDPPA